MKSSNLATIQRRRDNDRWNISPANHVLAIELRHLFSNTLISGTDVVLWDDLSVERRLYI